MLQRAQQILRKTFGMELHEIMSRVERDRADATREGVQAPDGEANVTGIKRKGTCRTTRGCLLTSRLLVTTPSSKQYILRSVLGNTIIEAASVYDVEIEDAEKVELALWRTNNEEHRPDGTLLTWRHGNADQLGMVGVLHVILALILVNGRVLTHSKDCLCSISSPKAFQTYLSATPHISQTAPASHGIGSSIKCVISDD